MGMSNESMNAMDNMHRERLRRVQPIPVATPPAAKLTELDALLAKIKRINDAAPWTEQQLAITQGCEQAIAIVKTMRGGTA